MLFAITLEDVQKHMRTLEEFCIHTKLSVNSSYTKSMLVMRQIKDKQCIMYNHEQHETMESLNTLALTFPHIIDEINVLSVA